MPFCRRIRKQPEAHFVFSVRKLEHSLVEKHRRALGRIECLQMKEGKEKTCSFFLYQAFPKLSLINHSKTLKKYALLFHLHSHLAKAPQASLTFLFQV
jgi:hypothetical protein